MPIRWPEPQTPRVPIQTPVVDERGQVSRHWTIFIERLGMAWMAWRGWRVIGWDVQDSTVGLDVSDPVIPQFTGAVARCFIRVKAADAVNALEIDIRNNGASIFATKPLIAATAGVSRSVLEFPAERTTIHAGDDVVLDIAQGGDWQFCVYLPYEANAPWEATNP
jgi:hypothetical protein